MPTPDSGDGWDRCSLLVLHKLERLDDCYEAIRVDISEIRTEVATLRVRAGVWGAIGATIPIIGMLLWQLLK